MATEQEGVIKFQMRFTAGDPPSAEQIAELNAWRKLCYLTKLIGQDAGRYDGYWERIVKIFCERY